MISINNLDELNHFANVLVRHLEPSDLILLNGDLGAGKTTLTQFIGKHLGVKRNIKSYKGSNLKLHHMDCYRLEDSDEDLGFDEYFQDEGITIIEWSQFIQDLLPKEHLIINIETLSETKRTIKLEAQGTHYLKVKEEVESEFIND